MKHYNYETACFQVHFGPSQEENIACQCNATHCDQVHFEWPHQDHHHDHELLYLRVVSSKSGHRFRVSHLTAGVAANQSEVEFQIELDAAYRLQQVAGFGGAFTDSASLLLSRAGGLSEPVLERLLEDYFGRDGLDYELARLPIGGTDMSWRPYSYNDQLLSNGTEPDLEHTNFRLQKEDLELKIPLVDRVNRMRAARFKAPLKLVASSWSPPAWMKSNRHLVQGNLRGNSTGPFYESYAKYIVRFLDQYQQRGLTMWALTPQNEPWTPARVGPLVCNFNSLNLTPQEMADFLEDWLIPELIRSGRRSRQQLKLFIWDDVIEGLQNYLPLALQRAAVANYTAGLSLHWYSQGLNRMPYSKLYETRASLPAQYEMISTEASFVGRPQPGNWSRGLIYARDIIENLRAGSTGWIDWNLALDTSGGPTWASNYLDAAVLVEPEADRYLKNPMFYALGHLSRFVRPNSRVLSSQVRPLPAARASKHHLPAAEEPLLVVGAELESSGTEGGGGPDGRRQLAMVLLNQAPREIATKLKLLNCPQKRGQPELKLDLPASSITSLAFTC